MEEVTIDSVSNKQKKPMSAWLIALIVGVVVTVCAILIGVLAAEETEPQPDLTLISSSMDYEYSEYLEEYTATITGVIKNTSGKKLTYASVTFAVYDAAGNSLGTAYDNISGIVKDGTWSFEAILLYVSNKPVTYKLIEVTTW